MNNLPLQPLVWGVDEYTGEPVSNSLLHGYIVMNDGNGKFKVAYYLLSGGTYTKFATGFATIDDAKTWAWDHYNEKMQPYVKPSPTWINYKTEKPKEGDDVVITWLWMGDRHTIHLGNYSPRKIDYLDDAIEVYWSISPFVKQGE